MKKHLASAQHKSYVVDSWEDRLARKEEANRVSKLALEVQQEKEVEERVEQLLVQTDRERGLLSHPDLLSVTLQFLPGTDFVGMQLLSSRYHTIVAAALAEEALLNLEALFILPPTGLEVAKFGDLLQRQEELVSRFGDFGDAATIAGLKILLRSHICRCCS